MPKIKVGRNLISYLNSEDNYGSELTKYLQHLLTAAQCLSNVGVFEDEATTKEAALFVIDWTMQDLVEAKRLIKEVR